MSRGSAYDPHRPARRPGGRPEEAPRYRVLVHRQYLGHWGELVERVGLKQAQQFWDHVSRTPGSPDPIASISLLKGRAGRPKGEGWSRTFHYRVSSSARIDYQYCDAYTTGPEGDPHPVVVILTVNYSSH
ncbi:hypothetical protein DP939_04165 [Spongiactinospora rosea]|uniref:Uncharacterized protein n=1 Tax=Spongiactinospora rosea TaxID=2248750 RepID=A0A366M6P6_9ACTN|nr:hypothetical protein DP939_04165 [Spongiactinospora rosea]